MRLPRLDPSRRRKLVVAAVALFLVNFLLFDILPLFSKKPTWEEVAKTINEVSRTTMPKTQPDGTVLLEVRPDNPWEFTYRYKVDGEAAEVARDPETREVFAKLMREQHEKLHRESETQSMGLIRRLGITCIHRYEDAAGGLVLEVKVGPKATEGK